MAFSIKIQRVNECFLDNSRGLNRSYAIMAEMEGCGGVGDYWMERVFHSMLKEQRVSCRSPIMTTLGPGADQRVGYVSPSGA